MFLLVEYIVKQEEWDRRFGLKCNMFLNYYISLEL